MDLIIFTGNIGCGKSLVASKYAKKGYVVVNMDSITTMVQGGEYGIYDKDKRVVYHETEDACIRMALKTGFSVVVDRTNMKVSDRRRYIDIGKQYNACIHSHDWGPGNERSLNRRLSNPNGITAKQWRKVHKYMQESYESPSLDEGFHSKDGGIKDYIFHAFDFDGTIVENKFPEIGNKKTNTVKKIKEIANDLSNIIIIWTCRSHDNLNEMRAFLLTEDIFFDFINENPVVGWGSPKIYAHYYHDDRNEMVDKDEDAGLRKEGV